MKMIPRLIIDSTAAKTDLCLLGQVCGTDKSPYNTRSHRHPYTAVYSMLFAPLRNKPIRFAEIGVAAGNSAVLWESYFTHPDARIHMYDRDKNFLEHGRSLVGPRFEFAHMDVSVDGDIAQVLSSKGRGELFDVIIDDSSHEHGHQIRIIREAWPRLKPGGILVIEDIFRSTAEEEYAREIPHILEKAAAAYFVVCEHADRWSPGWDNDKLLVLVKA
jgi:predicted O-methyltransferase YrrM